MNYLIIESHPYEGSFNSGVASQIKNTLEQKGNTVCQINLVSDAFNPVMTSEDLKLWGQGKYADPLVEKYQSEIKKTDLLIFPIPIWWGIMPAILKGFCDKVLLPTWAYKYGDNGEMIGLLTDKKAVVISTMETPSEIYQSYFNNALEGAFIKDTLETCGIEVTKYFQIDKIVSGGRENAETKMKEITSYFNE